jgi:hypothetical protein
MKEWKVSTPTVFAEAVQTVRRTPAAQSDA